MGDQMQGGMILARKSQLKYYRNIELFTKNEKEGFALYKPRGMTLADMRISQEKHPTELYLKTEDKLAGLNEAQKGFNRQLKADIKSDDPAKIKGTLVNIVEETLTEPRSGSLEGFAKTTDILVTEYASDPRIIKNLTSVSFFDYSTAVHSINVMALTLGFCFYCHYSREDAHLIGLSALLHDVGKTRISPKILKATRKLTDKEFEEIKKHPKTGFEIIKECDFESANLGIGSLEHHEKMDGSGYPDGKTKISLIGQILSIVDCYEAITNDDRPYRSAMTPIGALSMMKEELDRGKYNKDIFEKFAYSLV